MEKLDFDHEKMMNTWWFNQPKLGFNHAKMIDTWWFNQQTSGESENDWDLIMKNGKQW